MLANTQTIVMPFATGDVDIVLSRVNQDNFGSTFFAKEENGTEHQLKIKHSYEGKPSTGQYERHVVDYTQTSYDANGLPVVFQTYTHIRTKRGVGSAGQSEAVEAIARFVINRKVELLNREV